jgi:5-(carboxyamino)imidazole ribonucleotide synthase
MSHVLQAPVAPGGTIGILGGGQLGRMLALAAARLGLKTHIYCDEPSPAFEVAAAHTLAAYDDEAALARFAASCDVASFEFENVPAAAAAFVAARVAFAPRVAALELTQDRLAEKTFATKLGLRTAPFAEVSSAEEARAAFAKIGAPAVLKTRRFGYDGKGQAKVSSPEEVVRAFDEDAPAVLEGFIDFAFEVSVVAARGRDGAFAAYDPVENVHENHILRRSTVPSRLAAAKAAEAALIARKIAEALDYVGVFAVELFATKDGALLVNEIAPRVHNSGHWTIEACSTSQFEQHIRAIAGWPLGSPQRHSNAVMENILGAEAADWLRLSTSGALHLYGKKEMRPGRKMGHLTRLFPRGER